MQCDASEARAANTTTTQSANEAADLEEAIYVVLTKNAQGADTAADEMRKAIAARLGPRLVEAAVIDWQHRAAYCARMRIAIKHALARYRYPKREREEAIRNIMGRAHVLLTR